LRHGNLLGNINPFQLDYKPEGMKTPMKVLLQIAQSLLQTPLQKQVAQIMAPRDAVKLAQNLQFTERFDKFPVPQLF
jgi:hypothetical protein